MEAEAGAPPVAEKDAAPSAAPEASAVLKATAVKTDSITAKVEVPVAILEQVALRLSDKRSVVEKEVIKYGDAPSGIKEVFELCRGFERAYVNIVNESPVAMKIKDSFGGEKGLNGTVRGLPLEKTFELVNIKLVCRRMDGYQPHLISPEKGLRGLATEALNQVQKPVSDAVQDVYALLINAAREAAEKAGNFTEAALVGTALPMYVPDFKNVIMPAIVAALDDWKKEAIRVAMMIVEMEKSYITAGFFRHTMHNRSTRIKQQQLKEGQSDMGGNGDGQPMPGQDGKPPAAGDKGAGNKFFPSFDGDGKKQSPPPGGFGAPAGPANDDDSDDDAPGPKRAPGGTIDFRTLSDPNEYLANYFDKYVSDDSSTRAFVPDSWRYQRRFFIFSDAQKTLYYFKSPEDVNKTNGLRGQVYVGECIIEDLNQPKSAADAGGEKQHLMIRIRHKDPRKFAVKEHNALIMRAENKGVKDEWLARLQRAVGQGAYAKKEGKKGEKGKEGEDPSVQSSDPSVRQGEAYTGPKGGPGPSGVHHPEGKVGKDDFDMQWAKDAEPVIDTHMGEGSSAFRAEDVRDASGKLLPAPFVLLNPLRMQDKLKTAAAGASPYEVRYDALLEQSGSDMSIYTRMVCDTVCITVPKAVVHCMVKKSEKNLLEKLFTVIHNLTPAQTLAMLKEDDSVVVKRAAARKANEELKSSLFAVTSAMEKLGVSDKEVKVALPVAVFAWAGVYEFLTPEQLSVYKQLLEDPNMPEAIRFNQVSSKHTLVERQRPAGPPGSLSRPSQRPPPPAPGGGGGHQRPPPMNPIQAQREQSLNHMARAAINQPAGGGERRERPAGPAGGVPPPVRRPPPPPPPPPPRS